ncbi:MAG: hypothetical protein LUP94_00955 [Candidatus Methanomethylicus sp.]|nr:hypothetical protein [Candidatus Methanomethylicus sp.]
MTINIVTPRCRAIPLNNLLTYRPERCVLRPGWHDDSQREAFISAMESFKDRLYDTRKALIGIGLHILYAWFALRVPLRRPAKGTRKWVCTEAILENLRNTLPSFRDIERLPLDYYRLGFSTTNDFLRIARMRPDLLQIIE